MSNVSKVWLIPVVTLCTVFVTQRLRAEPGGDDATLRFWSFQPVGDPRPPAVRDGPWPRGDLDRFVLARLEAEGLTPAPDADKRTLIRRATFDLTGLPPTPEEIDSFLNDASPDAFAKVVDRLLGSKPYGERWARHWLDVVRYADTSGCNADVPIPQAYRYRNYVIDAFNRDKPYDRFIREQIAGDLLEADSPEQHYEQIIATGYLAISRRFSSLAEEFHLTLDDTIDNIGKGVLGLSLSCARCHDHKYDPLPSSDYYALYGILSSTRYAFPGTEIPRHSRDLVPLVSPAMRERVVEPYYAKLAALDTEIDATYAKKVSLDTGKERNKVTKAWKALVLRRDELIKKGPVLPTAFAVSDGRGRNARLHIKGDPTDLGDEVPRGFLRVLGGQTLPDEETGSGRLQLAEWLTDKSKPLTARVMVNRIWQHHFGQGIVRTPNDFGARGQAPTHPDLLDHLATRFMQAGWSIKAMHRLMMASRTYRMACVENADAVLRDPDNRWRWTFHRRRLAAEEIRDAMLAVSGSLDRSVGGAHPFKPEWKWRYTQHKPFVDDFATDRRSIYLLQPRIQSHPILGVFDGADGNVATGIRMISTTPVQALFMMNNRLAHTQAERFADRVLSREGTTEQRIDRAYQLAFGRPASADEIRMGQTYLRRMADRMPAAGTPETHRLRSAWASYLRVLYSSNEFFFVE